MPNFIFKWSMNNLILMIVKMLTNKFDCFIIIEGQRGLGKSTLGYTILKKVASYFRLIEKHTGKEESPYKDWYKFYPKKQLTNPKEYKYIIYKQEDVLKLFNKWHSSSLLDEMINVAFNRDFWGEDQKNLIKIINMNRDHGILAVACVPQFQVIDNQVKNLCKIRITITRRGLAVIQTPNHTIYSKDRWDTSWNEKAEREWLKGGKMSKPQYTKLSTFRGVLRFPDLNPHDRKIYEQIKINERNVIAKTQFGISDDKSEEKDIYEKTIERLLNGEIRSSQILEGVAFGNNLNERTFKNKLSKILKEQGKNHLISTYYWDKKGEKAGIEIPQKFKDLIED